MIVLGIILILVGYLLPVPSIIATIQRFRIADRGLCRRIPGNRDGLHDCADLAADTFRSSFLCLSSTRGRKASWAGDRSTL